jgi:hypothetical protein
MVIVVDEYAVATYIEAPREPETFLFPLLLTQSSHHSSNKIHRSKKQTNTK